MKRIIALVCALILMMAVAAPIASADTWKTAYVKTNSGIGLNAREAPSTDSRIITTIPYGAEVTITGYTNNKSWASIRYQGGNAGYVSTRYLVSSKPGPYKPTPTPKPTAKPTGEGELVSHMDFSHFKLIEPGKTMIIAARPTRPGGWVNLRWAPSLDAEVIAKMVLNEEMTVIAEGKNWYQVMNAEGYVGFINKQYTAVVYYGDYQGDGVGMAYGSDLG